MKAAWKQGIAAVMACADLAHLNPLGAAGRARRAKLFVYGFALAFGACTVYLAVSSSLPASPSPAAAWFGGVFASTSPYRSQISNFFSSIFPTNSSSSSLSPELRANDAVAASGGGQVGSGVGSSNSSTVEYDEQWGSAGGSGVPAGNSTGLGAATAKSGAEDGGGAPSSGPASGNVTAAVKSSASDSARTNDTAGSVGAVEGSGKDGVESNKATSGGEVPISNQTGSAGEATKDGIGVGSQGSGAPHKNQTVVVSPAATTQNQTRLGVASGGGGGAVNKSAGLAQDYSAQAITSKAGNYSSVLVKGNESPAQEAGNAGDKKADWIMETASCDMFHGRWVLDDSYPLYPEGSCPHIDEPFDCYLNGRPDRAYQKLRWQPNGCSIPRLDPADMLERLRGKRLVFVGDSLNRNMWESLVCILRNSIKDKKKVFEASGRHEFKTEGSYSFLFTDYNCSVEFFRSPFLVQEWEVPISNGKTKETLRLDLVDHSSPKYKDADFIIFNTGHWWTHEKTSLGKDYYQEGSHVYSELNVEDAFRKALTTWAKWIDSNVNPKKTAVFFRGYSASHFSGGQWNSGGSCDKEIEPITNEQYLSSYPPKMSILEDVIHGMKTPAIYLNVTRMTDYRKDAHPSVYRKQYLTEEERRSPERFQDCSHWCLPGVPDSWNELLYAQFLIKQHQMLHQ